MQHDDNDGAEPMIIHSRGRSRERFRALAWSASSPVACLVWCGCLSAQTGGNERAAQLLTNAAPAIHALAESRDAIAETWPGFWKTPAFGIYEQAVGVVVYDPHGIVRGGMTSLARHPSLEPEVSKYVYAWWWNWPVESGVIPLVPGLKDMLAGGGGIEIPQEMMSAPIPIAVSVRPHWPLFEFIVHESFHAFQIAHFAAAGRGRTSRSKEP